MEVAIFNRWRKECAERRLIIVAPLPGEAGEFSPNDLVASWRVVEHMLKDYHIDPNRVVMHSFLRGGPFATLWKFSISILSRRSG